MTDNLDFENKIFVKEVKTLKANLPLDKEQLGWIEQAYKIIEGYKGKTVAVKEIDEVFESVGKIKNNWSKELLENGAQILSLRTIKLSEADKKELAEYGKKQKLNEPGVSYWRPVVGNKLLYLSNRGECNQLFFGVINPGEVDGELSYITLPMATIEYKTL
ncbi:MAG: hypothetical protein JSV92_04860 [archaeon]|nr:MAG: hypothetical protein JSV92_04860 [archaeon]